MARTDRPNLLYVSIDSLRWDEAGFGGGDAATTPFLRGFADRTAAAVYDRAVTPATWTLPAHASLFTGLYPPEHGLLDTSAALGDHPTLAELLAAEGYETAAFFQNGWLRVGDALRGFESGTVDAAGGGAGASSDGSPSLARRLVARSPRLRSLASTVVNDYAATVRAGTFRRPPADGPVVESAAAALPELGEPFCAFVHLNGAHWPYTPPRPHHRRFTDRSALSLFWNRAYWQRRVYDNRERTWDGSLQPPAAATETMRELYRGAVHHVDSLVERLVSRLERAGRLDDTVVVVFGDHGDAFGDGGVFGHHFSLADGVVHVPLLVRDPHGVLPSGERPELAQLADLYPTLLARCGVAPPATNSVDLADGERETAFTHFEYTDRLFEDAGDDLDAASPEAFPPRKQVAAWRSPSEKLVWYPETDEYDGPAADDEDLRAALRAHLDGLDPVAPRRTDGVSGDVRRNLEDMGYL